MSAPMHAGLVKRAARWLELSKGCKVVATDGCQAVHEMPDAFGWLSPSATFLVECKTSRADFLRDADKSFRRMPALGMGINRFYLTPPGLLTKGDLPDGWGLIEAHPGQVRTVRPSASFSERNVFAEQRLLLTMAAQWQGALADLHRAWRRSGR